ncbi:alpha/beta hydrolase [Myxococcus dinghuensis]|uniref:alpha/beta hydrolase n=1 Tax=Myxococcus dinghuensis TaxID=2906761 RepID=UPI00225E17F8|nr:alpha/beta hydrolase [Myxococcus dinghuensis]
MLQVLDKPVAAPVSRPCGAQGGWAFVLGLVLSPLAVLVMGEALYLGASPSGHVYAVGGLLVAAGLLTRRWRRWRGLTRGGVGLLVLVALFRVAWVGQGPVRTVRLETGRGRWLNRLVSERDGTLVAAHLLLLTGRLPARDAGDLLTTLRTAFDRIDGATGAYETPAIATYLGLQSPDDFDAVVIPPQGRAPPRVAVVFLHGFAGNFAVYCWQMAQAARAISALTVCPSVGPTGRWWGADGARTLDATLAWLASQGIRRVYLSGLSNGGVGASVLAARAMPPGLELRGLVLVSGALPSAPVPRVPTLVVQGRGDSMMPTSEVRAYVERLGALATSVEVDSGHFAFLDRRATCERAISAWLVRQERAR